MVSTLKHPSRGVALITTLLVVVLISIIVISFFAAVTVALRSSSYHADDAELQNLKDSAVSLALGQIRAGTTREGELWVSQPGAIRTFGESDGKRRRIFKLYSDDEMEVDASGLSSVSGLNLTRDVASDWKDKETIFVDLNEPTVSVTDRDLHFPIVDPRLYDGLSGEESETPEGFSYGADLAGYHVPVGGVLGPADVSHPDDQRLPMPVRWIYVLRDGSLGTLNDEGSFVPFRGENEASRRNPIVGRFAFWTDDESAKINVNTASESIPWDTPRCATPEDVDYAKYSPVRNEVQRFGGHPASTSLSSVFFPREKLDPVADRAKYEAIYDLVPRVNQGGYLASKSRRPVSFDSDRLYANIEEVLLMPDRTENALFRYLGREKLTRSKFLLTTNSRAPEVTAAGTPRICLWPVNMRDNNSYRTAFDQLIAFNSILNDRPYLYLRNGANTNIGEYNTYYLDLRNNDDLLKYLTRLGRETRQGYPVSFEEKYGTQNSATGIISMAEYLRQTNLHDSTMAPNGRRVVPYARPLGNSAWGTEIHGQVTNIDRRWLPRWMTNRLGGLNGERSGVGTNGIGRIYTTSELGLAFCLAAEHKADGSKFNEDLVEKLKLPMGFKAVQLAPVFEGFNPAQGYTMSAPSSSARMRAISWLRLVTSEGTRAPGGAVTNPKKLTQQSLPNIWGRRGGILHTPAFMRNLAPGDTASEKRYSAAEWWVGWGGSGGRWLYVGSDSTNSTGHMRRWRPYQADFEDSSRKLPNQYCRGFFLVPSDDETVELTTTRGDRQIHFETGNQRNGDFSRHLWRLVLPPKTIIPVPEEPQNLSPTWGERYVDARQDGFKEPEILDSSDVVRTWVSRHGDHRLSYIRERERTVPEERLIYVPHPDWDPDLAGTSAETERQIHSFTFPGGTPEPGATFKRGLVRGVNYAFDQTPDFTVDPATDPRFGENRPPGYPYALDPTDTRDWDNGTGIAPDGAYWNKVDDVAHEWRNSRPPYFSKRIWDGSTADTIDETSAPNQQVPSAAIFGSLNSAAASGVQWTTYLFRPELTPGGHLGAAGRSVKGNRQGAPPDHVVLDWFWMPVVQPYAISERFSTAGKVNLNYRLAPFSYIHRSTGLHAVFKSERLLAIPTSAGQSYKDYASASSNRGWRHRIDSTETLRQFEERFNKGQVFRLGSEICEQFLVPEGERLENMERFWNRHRLSGDNTLERPYANIYPRVTTKSNVFRVHLIAQTLKKNRESDPDRFEPERDHVTGEYRGEALIERAIDPNDPEIPDYISEPDAPRLDEFYQYRILYTRRFAP